MQINVIGSGCRKRALVESIAEYSLKKLLPRTQNLEVTIQLVSNLYKKDNVEGDCLPLGEDCSPPKEFYIRVDSKLPLKDMLSTVAHELVHVKQFAKGELYDSTVKDRTRWHGQWMKRTPDYWDLPWEIEAYGREVGLYTRWVRENGYQKYKRFRS